MGIKKRSFWKISDVLDTLRCTLNQAEPKEFPTLCFEVLVGYLEGQAHGQEPVHPAKAAPPHSHQRFYLQFKGNV